MNTDPVSEVCSAIALQLKPLLEGLTNDQLTAVPIALASLAGTACACAGFEEGVVASIQEVLLKTYLRDKEGN